MSKRKSKTQSGDKKILGDHRRAGKKFIPPMMDLPTPTQNVSYVDDILPELIWIALLIDRVGYNRSAWIMKRIFHFVDTIINDKQNENFALISSFNTLNTKQKAALNKHLDTVGALEELRNSSAPLILLYDSCPISFIGPIAESYANDDLLDTVKNCVGKVIDRFEPPGYLLMHAIPFYLITTKKLRMLSKIKLPNVDDIINSPDSLEAELAGSSIRSMVNALLVNRDIDSSWAKEFWSTNMKISSCDFIFEENGNDK